MQKVLEVVLKALEAVLYMLELVNGVRLVPCVMGVHTLYAILYSRGRGGRALFAGVGRVMRYALEGEKDARCVVGVVMCATPYAGGWRVRAVVCWRS